MKLCLRICLLSFLINVFFIESVASAVPGVGTTAIKELTGEECMVRLVNSAESIVHLMNLKLSYGLLKSIVGIGVFFIFIASTRGTREEKIQFLKIEKANDNYIFSPEQEKVIKILKLYYENIEDIYFRYATLSFWQKLSISVKYRQNFFRHPKNSPEELKDLNDEMLKGLVLYGNPGNGKSEYVKELAWTLGAYYVQVTLEHIEAKWRGDAEKNIQSIFKEVIKKSESTPVVLFIDEFENIGKNRQNFIEGSGSNHVSLLLQKFVDIRQYPNIVLVVATNLKKKLDKALMRPGRFDVKLLFDEPNEEQRKTYITNLLSKNNLNEDLVNYLTEKTKGGSYADIKGCIKTAKWDLKLENRTQFEHKDFSFDEIGKSKMINYHPDLVM